MTSSPAQFAVLHDAPFPSNSTVRRAAQPPRDAVNPQVPPLANASSHTAPMHDLLELEASRFCRGNTRRASFFHPTVALIVAQVHLVLPCEPRTRAQCSVRVLGGELQLRAPSEYRRSGVALRNE